MSWVDSAVEWDERCEVLVLGSGGGGLTGAYTDGREGLHVMVAEATDRFGGTTAYSGGGMWFPGNPVLRRAGDDDTPEDALECFRAVVGDRTPVESQRAFVTGGAPLVEYLEQDPALRFQVLSWPDYFGNAPRARPTGRHIIPVPLRADALGERAAQVRAPLATDRRSAPVPGQLEGGRALIGRLLLALRALPTVELKRRVACRELIRLDGRVVGASVSTPQGLRRIRATHGVLVAAGGFERNSRMRSAFGVPGFARDSMAPSRNTGAAIEAAMGVGGDVDLMNEAWWAPGLTHPDGSSTFSMWFTGGIFVDREGRRFTNESAPYDRVGRDVLAALASGRLELPYWMIYSATTELAPPVLFTGIPLDDHEAYCAAGLWHRADTLTELAELIGIPAQALTETVQRFNDAVDAGAEMGGDSLRPGAITHVRRLPLGRGLVRLEAQVLGHLLIQRGLEDCLGELLEQPIRTGQGQSLLLGHPDQLRRRQLLGRRFGLLLRHGIKCRHHGTFPLTIRSANQAGNTVRSTVPAPGVTRTKWLSGRHPTEECGQYPCGAMVSRLGGHPCPAVMCGFASTLATKRSGSAATRSLQFRSCHATAITRGPESYRVLATWFAHDRTTGGLAEGLHSRTEAMGIVRRVLELLASPPEVVGLITMSDGEVQFDSLSG